MKRLAGIAVIAGAGCPADALPPMSDLGREMPVSGLSRILVSAAVVAAVAAGAWALLATDALAVFTDQERLRALVEDLGPWGPLAVVALIAATVIVSFVPNAPVSLAAGAAYGQVWGTVYAMTGSVLGAVVAFAIARHIGYAAVRRTGGGNPLRRWRWARWMVEHRHSQNTLMGAVIVLRVLPFSNFDVISYLAGLTPLTFWRFTVATIIGNAPGYILLGYLGDRMVGMDTNVLPIGVLALGALLALPLAVKLLRSRRAKAAGGS